MEIDEIDPLRYALERGSEALPFVNAPLVMDYVDNMFSCTLPHWLSRDPCNFYVNEGFYLGSENRDEEGNLDGGLLQNFERCGRSVKDEYGISHENFPQPSGIREVSGGKTPEGCALLDLCDTIPLRIETNTAYSHIYTVGR